MSMTPSSLDRKVIKRTPLQACGREAWMPWLYLGESKYLGQLNLDIEDELIPLLSLVEVTELDGARSYHLKGSLPPFAVAYIAGDSSLEEDSQGAPVDMEMWIGVDDSLLRKMTIGFQHTDAPHRRQDYRSDRDDLLRLRKGSRHTGAGGGGCAGLHLLAGGRRPRR